MRRPELEDGGGAPGAALQEEGTGRSWHGEHTRVRNEKDKKEVEGQGTSPTARSFGGRQWRRPELREATVCTRGWGARA
jgi:hypothetical protein